MVEGCAFRLYSENEIIEVEFFFSLKIISLYTSIFEELEYADTQKVENKDMKWRFLEILIC